VYSAGGYVVEGGNLYRYIKVLGKENKGKHHSSSTQHRNGDTCARTSRQPHGLTTDTRGAMRATLGSCDRHHAAQQHSALWGGLLHRNINLNHIHRYYSTHPQPVTRDIRSVMDSTYSAAGDRRAHWNRRVELVAADSVAVAGVLQQSQSRHSHTLSTLSPANVSIKGPHTSTCICCSGYVYPS
jgi:hypothetical protein